MQPKPTPTDEKSENDISGLRVLLVEDTGPMADLIVAMLVEINVHLVQIAVNGEIALDLFKQDPASFDMIISDWRMPKMTGLELLKEVRALDPAIPFLMLTVRTANDAIMDAKDADVTAYITKPFKAQAFQAMIGSLFKRILAQKKVAQEKAAKESNNNADSEYYVDL